MSDCDVTLVGEMPVIGMWDRARVEQIVDNLVSNAVKYGAGKPVTVTVNLPPRPVKANAVAGVGLTTLPAVSLMLEETPNVYFVFLVCEAVVKVTVWPSLEMLAAVTPKAGVIEKLLAVPAPTMASLNTIFTLELPVEVTLVTVGRVVSPVVGGVQALRMNTKLRTAIRLVNIRAGFIGTTSKKR